MHMVQVAEVVPGLSSFIDLFEGDLGRYVVIGGIARELIYQSRGSFSNTGTKDIDIVLLAETLDKDFVSRFLSYVQEAGYENVTKDEKSQMFRYSKPTRTGYPAQIELLSKRPEYLSDVEAIIGKIPICEAEYSLSAIMLDDAYYQLLSDDEAVTEEFGLRTLSIEYLIVFKMRAYMDLKQKGRKGEAAKHRRDVFRLVSLLDPDSQVELPEAIVEDIRSFLTKVDCPESLLRNIGLRGLTFDDIRETVEQVYIVKRAH